MVTVWNVCDAKQIIRPAAEEDRMEYAGRGCVWDASLASWEQF